MSVIQAQSSMSVWDYRAAESANRMEDMMCMTNGNRRQLRRSSVRNGTHASFKNSSTPPHLPVGLFAPDLDTPTSDRTMLFSMRPGSKDIVRPSPPSLSRSELAYHFDHSERAYLELTKNTRKRSSSFKEPPGTVAIVDNGQLSLLSRRKLDVTHAPATAYGKSLQKHAITSGRARAA